MPTHDLYEPLNVLKPMGRDIWIVDGAEVTMRYAGAAIPFPTRMTVVRLASGEMWLHSPIAWDEGLAAAIAGLGPIAFLVAPNTLHHSFLAEWQTRMPTARTYGLPGLSQAVRARVTIDDVLTPTPPAAWDQDLDQCIVLGSVLTEAVFFHRPSRTLVLTDLIENFELARVRKPWLRWALRLFGGADPDGTAPRDMRWSFIGRHGSLRTAVARMIEWAPERIVLAHGRCYETGAAAELRRAFRWVL